MRISLLWATTAIFACFSTHVSASENDPRPIKTLEPVCQTSLVQIDAFGKVLAAAEHYETALLKEDNENLEIAMDELGIDSVADRQAFLGAIKIKPLLDSGVLYEAIAAEAVARGLKKKKQMEDLIKTFALLPVGEKQAVIEGILENLLHSVDDSIELSNLSTVRERAERFKMTLDEYSKFLRTWRQLEETDYGEAKLVILDLLRDPPADLVANVLKVRKQFTGFNWFRKKRSLRPRIDSKKNGGYDTNELTWYLEHSRMAMRTRFLKKHWKELNTEQLKFITKSKFWEKLPAELRLEIESSYEEVVRQNKIKNELKELELALKESEDALAESLSASKTQEPVPEKPSEVNVEDVIRMVDATSRYTDHSEIYDGILLVIKSNATKLNGSDYVKVVKAILEEAGRFRSNEWLASLLGIALPEYQVSIMHERDFLESTLLLLNEARRITDHSEIHNAIKRIMTRINKRPQLSKTAESAIKKEIADHVAKRFNDASWGNSVLGLIAGPIGVEKVARNPKELQTEIAVLKEKIASLRLQSQEQKALEEKTDSQ